MKNSKNTLIAKNLGEQIFEILIEKIISGEYKTGDRIDPNQLVDEFQVSRSPIKDALNKLYGEGIIDISPRKGHYIRKLLKKEVLDLFEFRIILEIYAAKKVAEVINPSDLDRLRDNMNNCLKIINNKRPVENIKLFELDRSFHWLIISLAQNEIIARNYKNIYILTHAVRTQFKEEKERTIASQYEHKEIFQAIESNNHDAIESAITKHLNNAKTLLLQHYDNN